jgi:hypothetical protein
LSRNDHREFGVTTRALAGLCHHCSICAHAARKPGSRGAPLGRLIRRCTVKSRSYRGNLNPTLVR